MESSEFRHKPGPLKQKNKSHKTGKHRSRGQLANVAKGKVSIQSISRKSKFKQSRIDRKHQAEQNRKLKKEAALNLKRRIGGERTPPHLVAVIGVNQVYANTEPFLDLLKQCDENATVVESESGFIHVTYPRFKERVVFYEPNPDDLAAVMDVAKVADTVLYLWNVEQEAGDEDEGVNHLFLQGLPSVAHVVRGLEDQSLKEKKDAKRNIQDYITNKFGVSKVFPADTAAEAILLIRHIVQQKTTIPGIRRHRPHMLADKVSYEKGEDDQEGTLKVTGYLRGSRLSVNGLLHICGAGDYQMSRIDASTDPYPLALKERKTKVDGMSWQWDETVTVLAKADPKAQESLMSENIPDPLDAEQTWPTEEELEEAEAAQRVRVKLAPKGTSDYQAAWIPDDNQDDDLMDDLESMDDSDMEEEDRLEVKAYEMTAQSDSDSDESSSSDEDGMEDEIITLGTSAPTGRSVTWGDDVKYDNDMDMEEEANMMEKYQAERTEAMFPDEIDTPKDMPARDRFRKYRGLKSFRTTPWDPKENLPLDYARIFQFENFKRFAKKHSEEPSDGVVPGWFVTVHVAGVTEAVAAKFVERKSPLVMFGLLPHERKMSLINVLLKKRPGMTEPIQSKERLFFQIGYRRFSVCPIFSQYTNMNKQKFERFMPQDTFFVASFYAPIMYPPARVMVYKDSGATLVASGSLLSVDPDRMIIKRVVLSGHPLKINKRSAVVRYLFFNKEDIIWFKPVELRTKWGRRGHIKESLGTHGHMKCVFDGQLKAQDTVLLNLYKRVFPRWTYCPETPT